MSGKIYFQHLFNAQISRSRRQLRWILFPTHVHRIGWMHFYFQLSVPQCVSHFSRWFWWWLSFIFWSVIELRYSATSMLLNEVEYSLIIIVFRFRSGEDNQNWCTRRSDATSPPVQIKSPVDGNEAAGECWNYFVRVSWHGFLWRRPRSTETEVLSHFHCFWFNSNGLKFRWWREMIWNGCMWLIRRYSICASHVLDVAQDHFEEITWIHAPLVVVLLRV